MSNSSIFNCKTFSLSLSREQKNCTVSILNDSEQFCSVSFIDELEMFLDWLTNKTEISSVVFDLKSQKLELLSKSDLKVLDENAILNILKKVQRISFGQLVLPQTIIWNFKGDIDLLTLELSAGADLRCGLPSLSVSFDSLSKGISPMSSGASLLLSQTNQSVVRSYIMTGQSVNASVLCAQGLIHTIVYGDEIDKIITQISKQSPIARIQYKRSANDSIIKAIDETMASEIGFAKAALAIGDWKRWANDTEFANPREYAKLIRKTPTHEQVKESASA